MERKVWYLRQINLFEDMPDDFVEELHKITADNEYQKGELIFSPEEANEKVYILKKGQVEIYQLLQGKKIVIQVLKPGDVFGDISFSPSASGQVPYFAKGSTDCYLCVTSKNDFTLMLRKWPETAMRLLQEMGQRLHDAESKIKDLALHNIKVRLINELIRHAKKVGEETQEEYIIPDRLTHQELANLIGATRETITKALTELKVKGFIEIDNDKTIRVKKNKMSDVL
ncbi:Crp/Fnr family transcriptional regulator [Patescibacteria group bacterium]